MRNQTKRTQWWLLLVVTAIALYLCWLMVKPFAGVLAWAAVLVIVFYPVHQRLVRKTNRPALSALVSCILVVLTIMVPVVLVTIAVVREFSGAMQSLQANLAGFLDPNSPLIGRPLQWLSRFVDVEQLRSQEQLLAWLKGMTGSLAGQTLGFLGGAIGIIVQMFFVVFTMYYLFRDGDRIFGVIRDALPVDETQADAILARTRDVVGASVYGVLTIAIIQGTLGGLAFWVLGIPSAIVWCVVMIFMAMIPMLGAFVVWVPAAIYLFATGHYVKGILLVLWGTLVIGMIDNFLRPKL
ncbi:MAG: AI-2E family transporter, partial [Pyrinomonadaceae bacterium]